MTPPPIIFGDAANPGPPGPTPQVPVTVTTLEFDDDFPGTSLNRNNWAPYWFNEGNASPATHTPTRAANISVANSICTIQAASATSVGLISSNPFGGAAAGFQFGRKTLVQWLVYIPGHSGNGQYNWPSVWEDPQVWPDGGECDHMEGYNPFLSFGNLHDPSGARNGPEPSGNFTNKWIYICSHRKTDGSYDIYAGPAGSVPLIVTTGILDDDGGALHYLIGQQDNGGGTQLFGPTGALLIDRCTAWSTPS